MVKTNRKGGFRKGSGRKGFAQENLSNELISLGAAECIKALKKEGEYSNLAVEIRLDLASRFALKAIPNQINATTTEKKYTEIIHKLEGLDAEALRSLSKSCRSRALPEGAS